MARQTLTQFIWFPLERNTKYSIILNGVNITDNVLTSTFTRGIIGEDSAFEIELENSGENYTGEFAIGNIIQLLFDFDTGTTVQFEGKVEEIRNKTNNIGFILNIKGSHYTNDLLDITVTKEFTNSNVSTILTSITSEFLTGFTTTNVESINVTIDLIRWNNKPFYDCVVDLMRLANADAFVDNNKDIHFFLKNSKEITEDAVTLEDSLIELVGLGADAIDVRNKVIVYGDAGGLPVINTSEDSSSQTTYGIKEKVITDTSITDEDQAQTFADADKEESANPPFKGSAICLPLIGLSPGYGLWVSSPPHDITDKYRLAKYIYKWPEYQCEVFFSQDVGISKLFKDRIKKDLNQEKLTNPFKMKFSYNFTFDNLTKVNESASSGIDVSDGKLIVESPALSGIMVSQTKTLATAATSCHLLVIGENLVGTIYKVSFDGSDTYQTITPDTLIAITNTGKQLKIKVELNSTTVAIDSLAVYFR